MAYRLKMYQGDAKAFTLTILDRDGEPVPCDSATGIVFTARESLGGTEVTTFDLTSGRIVVGGTYSNEVAVGLIPADTSSLTISGESVVLVWDVEITFSANSVETFPRTGSGSPEVGELEVFRGVTE